MARLVSSFVYSHRAHCKTGARRISLPLQYSKLILLGFGADASLDNQPLFYPLSEIDFVAIKSIPTFGTC